MPNAPRPSRALVAACLVVVTWLSATPAPASALEPPQPLPGYRPTFVTETDSRPWKDCLWASGAMMLDKWTNGTVQVTRQELRKLSRDHSGGSTLEDLRAAYARLGFDLKFSPDGGERITWRDLLKRLEAGAGAVLLGNDSALPKRFGRWDRDFWKQTDDKDNHAVYIERYDRRRGRVWLMDPLARGDWHGEWISVRALRRFAWTSGGALSVAVTPPAKAAPYAGVAIDRLAVSVSETTLAATWAIKAPAHWSVPGADVGATFTPALDPLAAAARGTAVSARAATEAAPPQPVATFTAKTLRAAAALPTTPGAYLANLTLTDRRFGKVVARTGDVAVFVPGSRHATLRLHALGTDVEAGASVPVSLSVANTGEMTWAETAKPAGLPAEVAWTRNTRIVARWIPLDLQGGIDASQGHTAASATPDPVELQRVPLVPARLILVRSEIVAPTAPGLWALVVDVADDVEGSFAALGSAPAVHVFRVVVAREIAPID
jgi:hypothetical protein